MMRKIIHVTTVHSALDIRIFEKECTSLAKLGYEVTELSYGDVESVSVNNNVIICKKSINSTSRVIRTLLRLIDVIYVLRKNRFHVVHLHDPELLLIIPVIKLLGSKVIFDAHEDYYGTIKVKQYLGSLRVFYSFIYRIIELLSLSFSDGIICATDDINHRYRNKNISKQVIYNYPHQDFENDTEGDLQFMDGPLVLCYTGAITNNRGLEQAFKALESVNFEIKFNLAGRLSLPLTSMGFKDNRFPSFVNYYGTVSSKEVGNILMASNIGLVLSQPIPTYLSSLPLKMFEYLAAGIPVLSSNFPFWQDIFKDYGSIIWVDSTDPHSIAEGLDIFNNNKAHFIARAKELRTKAVKEFSWKTQEIKLYEFYKEILA